MKKVKKEKKSFFEELRLTLLKISFLAAFLLYLMTPNIPMQPYMDIVLEIAGIFFGSICILGRIWAGFHVAGFKDRTVVTEGPYSMVRHPLYFFSFIGVLGLALLSMNLYVMLFLLVIFLGIYPFVIRDEEQKLIAFYGEAYQQYMQRVPRFLPRLSQFQEPKLHSLLPGVFRRALWNELWYVALLATVLVLKRLHGLSILPLNL